MSIEQAVRTMLTAGSTISLVPDARVTHGYRLQDPALPAITFEVRSIEVASCGASPTRVADVEVRCIVAEPYAKKFGEPIDLTEETMS